MIEQTTNSQPHLDILHGAKAISAYLFGSEQHVRRVYWWVESGRLPHFKMGNSAKSGICARRSTLLNLIVSREGEADQ